MKQTYTHPEYEKVTFAVMDNICTDSVTDPGGGGDVGGGDGEDGDGFG